MKKKAILIQGKRVRKLPSQIAQIPVGTRIVAAVDLESIQPSRLQKIGFVPPFQTGSQVLPDPKGGAVSRRNALGDLIKHRDQPKETAYRQVEWHWQQWGYGGIPEDCSRIIDVPYKRYPRTFVPPQGVELQITESAGRKILASPVMTRGKDDKTILHTVNLFLELFGQCQVLDSNQEVILLPVPVRLNWQILPAGKRPWEEMRKTLEPLIQSAPRGNRALIAWRFEAVNDFAPSFTAVGQAGFRGYVVFGFPEQGIYVLESMHNGNATYLFGSNWEDLSKLTKAEILNSNLQVDRLIHRDGWQSRLNHYLKPRKKSA